MDQGKGTPEFSGNNNGFWVNSKEDYKKGA